VPLQTIGAALISFGETHTSFTDLHAGSQVHGHGSFSNHAVFHDPAPTTQAHDDISGTAVLAGSLYLKFTHLLTTLMVSTHSRSYRRLYTGGAGIIFIPWVLLAGRDCMGFVGMAGLAWIDEKLGR